MNDKQKQAVNILNKVLAKTKNTYDAYFTEEDYFLLMDFIFPEEVKNDSPTYTPFVPQTNPFPYLPLITYHGDFTPQMFKQEYTTTTHDNARQQTSDAGSLEELGI